MATPIPEGYDYDINTDTLTPKDEKYEAFVESMRALNADIATHNNEGMQPASEEVTENTGLYPNDTDPNVATQQEPV